MQRVDNHEPYNTLSCSDLNLDLNFIAVDANDGKLQFKASEDDYRNGRFYPGEYEINLCGRVLKSPSNRKCTPFILELVDPCSPPQYLRKTSDWPTEIPYTITDLKKTITAPAYEIEPSYCPFEVECEVSDITGNPMIVHTSGTANPPVFTIEKYDSLENIENGEEQSITCVAKSQPEHPTPPPEDPANPGPDPPSIETPPETVTVPPQNPCIDPAFVEINVLVPPLMDVNYNVGQGAFPVAPAHADYTITTKPRSEQHDLCGAIMVTPLYEGQPIDNNDASTPVTYNSGDSQFTVETADPAFEELVKEYGARAEFEDYPTADYSTVTSVVSKANIYFDDPCENPSAFNAVSQTSPLTDNYAGQGVESQLIEFEITPNGCKIDYSCTNVKPQDIAQADGIPTCDDFFFDGIMNDDGTDGNFRFVPTRDDYISGKFKPGTYIVEISGTTAVSQETEKANISIVLEDPCDPPTITPPADLVDQFYTLTDQAHTDYTTASWTVSPDYCELDYSQDYTRLQDGDTAVQVKDGSTFGADGAITYAFEYTKDLVPLDPTQTQTVTISATSKSKYGTNDAATAEVDFIVNFKNPCVDTDFVNVVAPDLPELTYAILSGSKVFSHPAFTVATLPFDHNLCGDLEYTASYNGVTVGPSDTPFAHNHATINQITIDSDDRTLIDTSVPYSLECRLKDHPSAPPATDSDLVKYISPCVTPTSFATSDQNDPQADDFSGEPISSNIVPFVVLPDICKVNYRCNSVVRSDGQSSNLDCDNFNLPPQDKNCANEDCPITITIPPEEYGGADSPKPGCFDLELCGSVELSVPLEEECTTMKVCLTDPCDPPATFTMEALTPQEYIIYNDGNPSYTRPSVVIVPDYCPYNIDMNISNFKDYKDADQSAISQSSPDDATDPTFYFQWLQDLSPMGQT